MSLPRARPAAPELDRAVREALVRRERPALEAFFDLYFDRVHGYLRRLVRDEETAEDLTQDVFLHVHRALDGYDVARPLGPWVFTIATNKLRDHWRAARVRGESASLDGLAADGGPAAPDGGADAQLESAELSARVARAIDDLPELLRETLVLRYHEGLSFEEIGGIVGRNETAVRKRYSRALQELRRSLGAAPAADSASSGPSEAGRT